MNMLYKKSYCELCQNTSCSDRGKRNIHFMDHNHCSRFDNGLIPNNFVKVPGGTFTMGSKKYEKSSPEHEVSVKSFYMSKYVVTNEEFSKFLGYEKSPLIKHTSLFYEGYNSPKQPIVGMTRKIAQLYAEFQKSRLPTEAEWEYACRLGKTFDINSNQKLDDFAWYYANNSNYPREVGLKQPNSLGIYDMFGNVEEFLEDDYHSNYDGAPTDGSAWIFSKSEDFVAVRGGNYLDPLPTFIYSARNKALKFQDGAVIGIRLVKDI